MDREQTDDAVGTRVRLLFGGDVEGGELVAVKGFEVAYGDVGRGFGGPLQRTDGVRLFRTGRGNDNESLHRTVLGRGLLKGVDRVAGQEKIDLFRAYPFDGLPHRFVAGIGLDAAELEAAARSERVADLLQGAAFLKKARIAFGRDQLAGEPIQEIRPGDIVWIAPGERHWHGAAPTTAMTHLAIQETRDGKAADWYEQVSDEDYGAMS